MRHYILLNTVNTVKAVFTDSDLAIEEKEPGDVVIICECDDMNVHITDTIADLEVSSTVQ